MVEEFVRTRIRPGDAVFEGARLFEAHASGVEVTQAIQYYRSKEHLTDKDDRAPDNAAEVVAYKAAWVRVYVEPGLFDTTATVTGKLLVERRNRQLNYQAVATYTPVGSWSVTADASLDYRSVRGWTGRTLNFVIPAKEFHGTLRVTPLIDGARFPAASVVVRPLLIQTLRIRGILVAYKGPSSANPPAPGQPPITQLTLPAPTLADLQSTSGKALAMMPVQATGSYASAGVLNFATPLDDMRTGKGECSVNWGVLLNWLELLRDNDGNRADVVYYGLLPSGIPLNVPGCGHNGLGSGAVGNQQSLVHEIGHGYNFDHTPSGDVGKTDPNYPTYEPYQSASIGEFGLDIRDGSVYDPKDSTDYMSYGPSRWMSLYQYDRLLLHKRLDPSWISDSTIFDDHPHIRPYDLEYHWWPDPPWLGREVESARINPVISIVGLVDDEGRVEVQSVARVRVIPDVAGIPTAWVAQLVGDDGAVLSRAPIVRLSPVGGCGCGGEETDPGRGPFRFKAYVPDVGPGAALRILNDADEGDREVWQRRPEREAPVFTGVGADQDGENLLLRWELDSDAESVCAQWTSDQGETWHSLAVGLTEGAASLPLTGLPAGEVAVRLLAHGGFFTGESDVLRLEVPARPPEVAVLHPTDGRTLPAGGVLQVAGNAVDQGGRPLPDDALLWLLDGQELGAGRELWIAAPDPGDHELVLVVRSEQGEATQTVRFSTQPVDA